MHQDQTNPSIQERAAPRAGGGAGARAAGAYALLAGGLTLVGWAAGVPRLTDWLGLGIAQKPNAALAGMLAGLALLCLYRARGPLGSRLAAAGAALIGGLTLVQHLTGLDLGIDLLLFYEPPGARATTAPGRMGPIAATSLTLIGGGLLLCTASRAPLRRLAHALGLLTFILAGIPLLGYLYGADFLYTVPRITGIAFQTTTIFLALSLGLMAAVPEHSIFALLRRDAPGGLLLRRLLIPAVLLPLLAGWLNLRGQALGLYDGPFGTAALTFVLILLLAALATTSARRVDQAAAVIAEQGERLRITLASIGDGLIAVAGDGRVTMMNPVAERLTGWTAAAAVGRPLAAVFHVVDEQTRRPVENPAERTLRDGAAVALANHSVLIARDGAEWPLDDSAAPIRSADGQIVGCVLVFREITGRRRAEAALRESEETFRAMFEVASVGKCQVDPATGRFLRVNATLCALTGYSAAQLLARTVADITHPDDREASVQSLARLARGEISSYETEERYLRPDGSVVWAQVSANLIRDAAGRPRQIVGVILDITARKQAEAALREADRRKDEFLATLAHELRNPLAPVMSSIELLDRIGEQPAAANARAILRRQVKHLTRLVDDLLDIGRISRDKLELRRERVELSAVLRSAVEDVRPTCEARHHALCVSLPDQPVWLNADPARLAQVVGNLLNNASKYTPEGGRIALAARVEGREAWITVTDSGVGLTPEDLSRVFGLFEQVHASGKMAQGGLGIGLSLVRRLVEMHGGTVTGHSAGPGQGSTFTVRLPVADAAPVAAEAPPAAAPKAPAGERRILVVDDNVDAADSLAEVLELLGSRTATAHDGPEALEAAQRFDPHVVLLDIGLPTMSGYDVCRELRRQRAGRPLVVVALTGWGQDEDRRASAAAGFDQHLVKPVDFDTLKALLDQLEAAEPRPAAAEPSTIPTRWA